MRQSERLGRCVLNCKPHKDKGNRDGDALVHYPVCSHPLPPFHLFSFEEAFAESSWESRLVVAVLEEGRVIHPPHHDRVKGARGRIRLGSERKTF